MEVALIFDKLDPDKLGGTALYSTRAFKSEVHNLSFCQ